MSRELNLFKDKTLAQLASHLEELIHVDEQTTVDSKTGEVVPTDYFEQLQGAFEDKVNTYIALIKDLRYMKAAHEAEADSQSKEAERIGKRIGWLENNLAYHLHGKKWECTVGKVTYTSSTFVHVMDEKKIPDKFFHESTKRSVSKEEIKKAILNGEMVDGAELAKKVTVKIK